MLHQIGQWPERFDPEPGKACLNYYERLPAWNPRRVLRNNASWLPQDYLLQIARRPVAVGHPRDRV